MIASDERKEIMTIDLLIAEVQNLNKDSQVEVIDGEIRVKNKNYSLRNQLFREYFGGGLYENSL